MTMSDFAGSETAVFPPRTAGPPARDLPQTSQYALALLLVGAATALAFVVREIISAPNLTLIYVLPVVIAAAAFGWGPSLIAALGGVLAFDFFFTRPYFSFRIYSPADLWAAALLLVTAAIVTTIAARARQRALEAIRACNQAEALQGLAHAVIQNGRRGDILDAAAVSLNRIFQAPAVIFLQEGASLVRAAAAGDPKITATDEEAARGALSAGLHTRAETYPYDATEFEFWPVTSRSGRRCVLGVDFSHAEADRPDDPARFTDVVAAYLAAALDEA